MYLSTDLMKILFVYPYRPINSNSFYIKFIKLFFNIPIPTFKSLENVTPEEHSIEIVDERIEEIDFEKDYDLIGISAMTSQAPRAYTLAEEFRKREKKVVLGGWHPSALPDEAKQYADSVVIGEGEELWPKLLKDFEKGKLKQIYKQDKPVDLSAIPIPENGRARDEGFRMTASLEATRGCPHGCDFCAITNSPGRRFYRAKPVDRVIKEIQSIPKKYVIFNDASLTINAEYSKQLFKEMKELNKKFFCYGNADVLLKDEELLKLAHDAGCVSWGIGFDSVSQSSLDSIGKKTNKADDYNAVIKKIHDFGMNIEGSFMFGFDTDTPAIFDSTLDFVCDSDVDEAEFFILTPFPGTPLFDVLEKQGRILTRDWSKYNAKNVVYKPKNMTAEDLIDGVKKMYEGFYTPSNFFRLVGKYVNKGLYPLITIVTRSFQGFKYSRNN